jgi:hypothetical protein
MDRGSHTTLEVEDSLDSWTLQLEVLFQVFCFGFAF